MDDGALGPPLLGDEPTLPDLLQDGLKLVFVGINPSAYSARVGHYFANPRNRFWPAFNLSRLKPTTPDAAFTPADDAALLEFGIGFTDIVKRPTPQANGLRAADYRLWAPVLRDRLLQYQPRMACFHGMTAYRGFLRYSGDHVGITRGEVVPELGLQHARVGTSHLFVTPNPSPANAVYSIHDLASWYDRVAEALDALL